MALLVLRGVGRAWRDGGAFELVLEDLALEVGAGQVVAVVGQRWEGKTTLLRLAAGVELADEGSVEFEGVDFAVLSRRARGELLGREIVWLDRGESSLRLEMLDYLGLPLQGWGGVRRGEARRLAAQALERVGAGHLAGRRAHGLSSWERVLVGLARAVVVRPKLLVVDDLFDALGTRRMFEVGDLLDSLVQEFGFGVLFSVSDFEAAGTADRVFMFDHRALKPLSDQTDVTLGDAEILPFPRRIEGL